MSELKETLIDKIMSTLGKIDYIRPQDIPNVDLYMDQVTTFMDNHLKSGKRYETDKILTKTMINNYTKNNLMPPPDKKKYSKEHMYLLIFIYYFKNILSMNDIQSLLSPLTEAIFGGDGEMNLESFYKELIDVEKGQLGLLKEDVVNKYNKAKEVFSQGDIEDEAEVVRFAFICLLSFDVYIKKQIIEQIIDLNEKPKTDKE